MGHIPTQAHGASMPASETKIDFLRDRHGWRSRTGRRFACRNSCEKLNHCLSVGLVFVSGERTSLWWRRAMPKKGKKGGKKGKGKKASDEGPQVQGAPSCSVPVSATVARSRVHD